MLNLYFYFPTILHKQQHNDKNGSFIVLFGLLFFFSFKKRDPRNHGSFRQYVLYEPHAVSRRRGHGQNYLCFYSVMKIHNEKIGIKIRHIHVSFPMSLLTSLESHTILTYCRLPFLPSL